MSSFDTIKAITVTGAFVFGVVLALVGSLKLALAKRLGIGEGRVGGLLSALHLAFIPTMPLAGMLIDRLDIRIALIAGCVLTALGLYTLTVRATYRAALISMVLMGVGAACVSTACVVLMPAFFDWDPRKTAAAVNVGMVFFALGSLVTPTLVDLLLRTYDLERFQRALVFLAILCLTPAVITVFGWGAAGQIPLQARPVHLGELLGDERLWLAGLVFFLYGPLEFAVGTWATTYLIEHEYSDRRAARLLSGFWLAFLAGRLLTAYLQDKYVLRDSGDVALIVVLGLAAAVVLGNLASAPANRKTGWGLLFLGLILGPIFPTLVGIVLKLNHPPGTAYGTMFAIGSLGGLVLAPLIGLYARGRTVQVAMRIPMALGLLMAAAATVLGLVR
ncbi:MAG TPA: MFS transporter [Gemmataceae bacterium]|nr:MFS transporter [Gemmataceae bacterium]